MRIRQVKPDFWTDELMASLPDAVRLFYIATWQLADDSGWLEWNIPEIGLRLYGYSARSRRERWVRDRGLVLVGVGRLVIHECGHAYVPNLTEHQRVGGRPVNTVHDAHARTCARLRADAPNGIGTVGKGTVGKGSEEKPPDVIPYHRQVRGA